MLESIGPFRIFYPPIEPNCYNCLNMIQRNASICHQIYFSDIMNKSIYERTKKYIKLSENYDFLDEISDIHLSKSQSRLYFFYEFPNHTLNEKITKDGALTDEYIANYFYQLISIISFLHKNDFPHGNINLLNISISNRNKIKLLNFKISDGICFSKFDEFNPPEFFESDSIDYKKGDIWSAGICLYVMIMGNLPWVADNISPTYHDDIIQQIRNFNGTFPDSIKQRKEFGILFKMLSKDPQKRPSAEEILQCEWLEALRNKTISQNEKPKKKVIITFFESIIDDIANIM